MLIAFQGSFQGCFSPDLTGRMMIRPLPLVGVGLGSSRQVWRLTASHVESAGGLLGSGGFLRVCAFSRRP